MRAAGFGVEFHGLARRVFGARTMFNGLLRKKELSAAVLIRVEDPCLRIRGIDLERLFDVGNRALHVLGRAAHLPNPRP